MSKEIINRIEQIQEEIRETPYHKGTEHHVGKLRARIAQLKQQLREKEIKESKGGGGGYGVKKQGDATVVLVGPPSAGKSTLLNSLTGANSKIGDYDFTTLDVIPGMFIYKGARIQLLDVPGLVVGAAEGRGGGKQVLSVARNSDLIVLISDVNRPKWIENAKDELYRAGVRLNVDQPDVEVKKTVSGGIEVIYPHGNFEKDFIADIAGELGFKNAKITIKEKLNSVDRLIDGLSASRVYLPSLEVINKTDLTDIDTNYLTISAENNVGLEKLKEEIWDKLNLIRVYLKREREAEPDYDHPLILPAESTVKDAVKAISQELVDQVDEVLIWGEKAKYPGQIVSFSQPLFDQSILYFRK